MKHITTIVLLLLVTACVFQNSKEFGKQDSTKFDKSDNGLVYSEAIIEPLRYVSDSLHANFKSCELNKTYFSQYQAKAHFISLEGESMKDAKKDMEANISFDDFIEKYSPSEIDKDLLVVRSQYQILGEEKDIIAFSVVERDNNNNYRLDFYKKNLKNYKEPLKGKWIYKDFYSSESNSEIELKALYFVEDFLPKPIPENYARMIQYADFVIDTSAQVFYKHTYNYNDIHKEKSSPKLEEFMRYIWKSINKYEIDTTDTEEHFNEYQIGNFFRVLKADSLQDKDENFNKLLHEAIIDVINNGASNGVFEEFVGCYYSKAAELELKRSRQVLNFCGTSSGQPKHLLSIAKLSAEILNWNVFLRSHLDIMRDYTYIMHQETALLKRKTYTKEFEALNINVLDLLLGISLRIENPSVNHYYGDNKQLGEALVEISKSSESEIETKMLQMISDKQLDDYNRLLIYNLFLSYNNHLKDKEKRKVNKEKLMAAVQSLPEYLSKQIMAKN